MPRPPAPCAPCPGVAVQTHSTVTPALPRGHTLAWTTPLLPCRTGLRRVVVGWGGLVPLGSRAAFPPTDQAQGLLRKGSKRWPVRASPRPQGSQPSTLRHESILAGLPRGPPHMRKGAWVPHSPGTTSALAVGSGPRAAGQPASGGLHTPSGFAGHGCRHGMRGGWGPERCTGGDGAEARALGMIKLSPSRPTLAQLAALGAAVSEGPVL